MKVNRDNPLLLLAGFLSFLFTGCGWEPPGKPKEADRILPPQEVLDFGALYSQNCAGCHGEVGRFGPAPPLNDPLFLAIVPDNVVRQIIRNGRDGTLMPAFLTNPSSPLVPILVHGSGGGGTGGTDRLGFHTTLTAEQIEVLAKGLKQTWRGAEAFEEPLPEYLVSAAPPGDEEKGSKVFAKACAKCHGDNGMGGEGTRGPVNNGAFLSLISDQALRRIVITGRRDLGMPDYNKLSLSNQDISDVVALMASWRTTTPGLNADEQ